MWPERAGERGKTSTQTAEGIDVGSAEERSERREERERASESKRMGGKGMGFFLEGGRQRVKFAKRR